jgi:hypothetical protein
MSLRTIQRLTIMSVFVLGSVAATGCGDDDDPEPANDAGDNGGDNTGNSTGNNTGNNTGGEDAGADAGDEPLMCGDETKECKDGSAAGFFPLPGCCTEDDKCGIEIPIPGLTEVFPGCQDRNAPAGSSDHAFCDGVVAMANGETGIPATSGVNIKIKGCCTMAGFCGVDANDIDIVDPATGDPMNNLSLELGCVSIAKFLPPGTPLPPPLTPETIPCELPTGDGG